MVWRSYYYESGRDPNFFQKIIDVQRDGQCCGFGPPMRCVEYGPLYGENFGVLKVSDFDPSLYAGTVTSDESAWDLYSTSRHKRRQCSPHNPITHGSDVQTWYAAVPLRSEEVIEAWIADPFTPTEDLPSETTSESEVSEGRRGLRRTRTSLLRQSNLS